MPSAKSPSLRKNIHTVYFIKMIGAQGGHALWCSMPRGARSRVTALCACGHGAFAQVHHFRIRVPKMHCLLKNYA